MHILKESPSYISVYGHGKDSTRNNLHFKNFTNKLKFAFKLLTDKNILMAKFSLAHYLCYL